MGAQDFAVGKHHARNTEELSLAWARRYGEPTNTHTGTGSVQPGSPSPPKKINQPTKQTGTTSCISMHVPTHPTQLPTWKKGPHTSGPLATFLAGQLILPTSRASSSTASCAEGRSAGAAAVQRLYSTATSGGQCAGTLSSGRCFFWGRRPAVLVGGVMRGGAGLGCGRLGTTISGQLHGPDNNLGAAGPVPGFGSAVTARSDGAPHRCRSPKQDAK